MPDISCLPDVAYLALLLQRKMWQLCFKIDPVQYLHSRKGQAIQLEVDCALWSY